MAHADCPDCRQHRVMLTTEELRDGGLLCETCASGRVALNPIAVYVLFILVIFAVIALLSVLGVAGARFVRAQGDHREPGNPAPSRMDIRSSDTGRRN